MKLRLSPETHPHLPGLAIFETVFADRIACDGMPVEFEPGRDKLGFSLTKKGTALHVRYASPCDAYRALGLILANDNPESTSQDRIHESVSVMWDLSRNGVIRPEAWEELFRKFALMGINAVQLYMEDVYEIPGEAFFGYGRGAYSAEELRRIDGYGHGLGIEVIPCIQTLGHLLQITQWPAYWYYGDVDGVLMVDDERTRKLIGKMLDQMAACFRSRTIHIGMDEAHGLGTGQYLRKNGYQRPFDIFNRHLRMVTAMCHERGLRPMIWSDMYFRMGSATNDCYDMGSAIPADVAAQVPADVDLVYWDYYHADPAFYEEWIRRHRDMGKEPIFAAGAWNWGRFWTYAPRWRESLSAGMKVAREQKLAQTMLTIWGDDGAEFHPASVYPAIQYFAEWAYVGEPDDKALERQFAALVPGANLPDYLSASQLDEVPSVRGARECTVNHSKWILWQDPVLGFLDAHLTPDLPDHYRRLAAFLDKPEADEALRFAAKVATAVGLKAELHLNARTAWQSGNRNELHRLKSEVLPACLAAVRELWQAHDEVWRHWNKPFGWEVIERRYAGCTARLEKLGSLLEECLNNPKCRVPEWEIELSLVHARHSDVYFTYQQAATPSAVK